MPKRTKSKTREGEYLFPAGPYARDEACPKCQKVCRVIEFTSMEKARIRVLLDPDTRRFMKSGLPLALQHKCK